MKMPVHLPRYNISIFGVLLFALLQPVQASNLGLTSNTPDFALATDQIFTYDANCDGTFLGDCNFGEGKLTVAGTIGSYTETLGGGIVATGVRNEVAAFGEGSGLEAFSLTAILDASGNVISGSFFINGVVIDPSAFPTALYNGFDHLSGNLLNGDLALFGFSGDAGPATGGLLEFTFGNAGGYIADPLYPLAELGAINYNAGGMILTVGTSTLGAGNFGALVLTDDWTGTGFGDVFVPVPAAVWLFGSGLIALLGVGRRRRNR